MNNQDIVGFGLRNIKTNQFAIIEDVFDEDNHNIELGTGIRFGINEDKKIVEVILSVDFRQEKSPFLLLEISCLFEIIEKHWNMFFNSELKELKLNKEFARHLVVISMGTLRGILHAKTENTTFNKFHLPTINVNDMVNEDITISLK